MSRTDRDSGVPGVALVNLQKQYVLHTAPLWGFLRELRRRLRLGKIAFNICFVDDAAIRRLNLAYRGQDKPTDVLSFPWREAKALRPGESRKVFGGEHAGIKNFLGDVVISVPSARRNALVEGHSTRNEIRWLILHGLLHLLGHDHEHDAGEMIALELALREQLEKQVKRQKAKGKRQK